jgi:hypothetical protein
VQQYASAKHSIGWCKAHDSLGRKAFAAARFAHKTDRLALVYAEIYIAHGMQGAVCRFKGHRQVIQL